MCEPIEQCGGELLVAGKDGDPLGEGEIRGDDGGPALVPVGDEIEEQLAADAVEGHEAELVDDQDVDPEQALLQARELTGIARLEELPDEIGRAGKEDAAFLGGRFDAEGDGEMRLPGADGTGQDEILGRGDPRATGERVDLRGADTVGRREIKRIEGLDLRKTGLTEPLADEMMTPGSTVFSMTMPSMGARMVTSFMRSRARSRLVCAFTSAARALAWSLLEVVAP